MAGFPSLERFPSALRPNEEGFSGSIMLIPLFVLLLGREEDNKTRSVLLVWFPNLLLLKAALSRLDVGPAYYEDPVSSNPI